jgi:hypothetical protein
LHTYKQTRWRPPPPIWPAAEDLADKPKAEMPSQDYTQEERLAVQYLRSPPTVDSKESLLEAKQEVVSERPRLIKAVVLVGAAATPKVAY